jgi:lysophospholipase L1-like esterase
MSVRFAILATGALVAPLLAQAAPAPAVDPAAEARAERPQLAQQFPDAFAPVVDDARLPRVLLIGDSISIGYTPVVREMLRGVANVHRIPDNGGPTTRGLALLDEWLGSGRWNVIHFNFGLHDIARPNGTTLRTTPADYEKNLRALVARLKATGVKLIFATTTPVPNARVNSGRKNTDVLICNNVAKKIMADAGIPVDDLYAVALPRLDEIQLKANVHYTPEGYRVLGAPVAAAIREQLPKK